METDSRNGTDLPAGGASDQSEGGKLAVDAAGNGQFDSDDAAGDAVSGATSDDDGVPTPTGSVPPGPGAPDEDDTTDATALPPLSERMY